MSSDWLDRATRAARDVGPVTAQEVELIRHNFSVCSMGGKVMSRGPQSFKQSDLTKAIKAAEKAGRKVQRAELRRDGSILLDFDRGDANDNEWDGVAK